MIIQPKTSDEQRLAQLFGNRPTKLERKASRFLVWLRAQSIVASAICNAVDARPMTSPHHGQSATFGIGPGQVEIWKHILTLHSKLPRQTDLAPFSGRLSRVTKTVTGFTSVDPSFG